MRTFALLGALLGLVVAIPAARAQEASPLTATPEAATLDAAGHATVTLANNLGVPLRVQTSVVDEHGAVIAAATATPPGGGRIEAGSSGPVAVDISSRPASATLIVVVAPAPALPRGAVVRVNLSATAPAKPAVDDWAFVNVHAGDDHGATLPLTGTCAGLKLTGPTKLGTVQSGGHDIRVTGTCLSQDATGLQLTIPDLTTDGRDYKGTITVAGTKVTLTVQDTLSWAIVALLIAIGIVITLAVSSWQGFGRSATDLIGQSYAVAQLVSEHNPASADRSFRKAAQELDLPANVQSWTIAGAVEEKLAAVRATLRGAPDANAITQAKKDLDALELDVRQWPTTANQLGEFAHREHNLEVLTTLLQRMRSRTLDRNGPLDLAAMGDVRSAAQEAAALANDWPTSAIEEALATEATLPEGNPASAKLDTVIQRFKSAATVADAKAALDSFWDADEAVRAAAAAVGPLKPMATAAGEGWTGLFEAVPTDDPAVTARALELQIRAIDLGVLLVLLAAAMVAGIQALWVGKSFGGFWDITSALAWGLGAGAVSGPLSVALTNAFRSSPKAEG